MKIAVGVLCWNQERTGRVDLFDDCLSSIRNAQPDTLIVADNGSDDGTSERVAALPEGIRFPKLPGHPHGNTCGYGMNKLAATLAASTDADLLVLSNDDIVWQPDAFERLRNVWSELDDVFRVVSGLVEPTFQIPGKDPWNQVLGVTEIAGELLWVRSTVPGGAWSFRRVDYPDIFPVSTFPGLDDVPACQKLTAEGFAVGAVELADHAGVGQSSWGNASHDRFLVEPVDDLKAQWISS